MSVYFYPRRKLFNIAVFSFTLSSSSCETSRIHLGTWFFPELDVFCLQGRTNLAAVALEAEGEQNSSRARYFVRPGALEGCHLFLLLRILLASLATFFWPWLGQLESGKGFFIFFWIITVSFLLRLLLLMFLFGESLFFFFFFLPYFFLRLWDKGKFWLEWSVLKVERKLRLRHQNRTSNIFPFAKQRTARKERLHPSSAEADGKCATDLHGVREPCEESKLTSLPSIIMSINAVLFVSLLQLAVPVNG